jgi:hypothetical protein
MSGRLLLALAAWTALPWITGRPGRVLNMYRDWLSRLVSLTTLRLPSQRDVLHLFEIGNVPALLGVYRALQVLGGLLVLMWTLRLRARGAPAVWAVSGAFALTIAYMLALGPAVEFAQYPLLAPWVSAALLAADRGSPEWLALVLVYLTTMVAGWGRVEDALSRLIRSPAPESLITLGTVAFAVWVILAWRRAPTVSKSPARSQNRGVASGRPGPAEPEPRPVGAARFETPGRNRRSSG